VTAFTHRRDAVWQALLPGALDPSSEPGTHNTCRTGFDLTKPLSSAGKKFEKTPFPEVDLSQFGL
jgi:hypothetical protein